MKEPDQKLLQEIFPIFQAFAKGDTVLRGGYNYRYIHPQRVLKIADSLMESPEISRLNPEKNIVYLAALFHDIARTKKFLHHFGYLETYPDETGDIDDIHSHLGAKRLDEILQNSKITPELLTKSKNVIRHQGDRQKDSAVEIKILQDADDLDEIGYANIWRMFSFANQTSKDPIEQLEYFFTTEYPEKQHKMERLWFLTSKKWAQKRLDRMYRFMKILAKEHEGADF